MLLDDSPTLGQPKAEAAACLSSGEEGVEKMFAFKIGKTDAAIVDGENRPLFVVEAA